MDAAFHPVAAEAAPTGTPNRKILMFSKEGTWLHSIRQAIMWATLTTMPVASKVLGVEAAQVLSFAPGRFLIQPQFDVSAQFTDNLFYASRGSESSGDSTVDVPLESDVLWYISPGLEIQYGRNPENFIRATAFFDQILYTENSDFNANQQRAMVDLRLEFGRFVLRGDDDFQWMETILGGSTAVRDRTPVRQFRWNENYRLTYDVTMKTDGYVGFQHQETDYRDPINLYDQNTLRGILGASYKPTERIDVFAEFQGGHTRLDKNIPQQGDVSPSNVYGGFVGAEGNFTARLDGSIKVGYEARDFRDVSSTSASSSPAVVMALNYTQSARRFFKLTYDRRVGVSSQVADQSYVFDLIYFTYTQGLGTSGRWLAQIRGGVTLGDYGDRITYIGPGGAIPINNARNDNTYSTSVSVIYQPNAWLTTSLAYQYEKFTTEFESALAAATMALNDYHANRVILQVSIGF